MYLIASGEAEVELGRDKRVVLKEGDFFGEMALFERRRHKHDVVAKTKCRIYVLDAEALSRLGRSHPEILRHIRQVAETRGPKSAPKSAQTQGRCRVAPASKTAETA